MLKIVMLIPWQNYSLILFDFDDTLVDFSQSERAAVKAVCANYDRDVTEDLILAFHTINQDLWRKFDEGEVSRDELFHLRFVRFFAALGVTGHPDLANEIFLTALATEVSLIANAEPLLTHLNKHAKIGIVSNGHGPTQRLRAERAGIAHLIHFSTISDDVGVGKPHRKMFDTAYESSGLPPGQKTLMIGDNLKADISGAHAVGFDTCWISRGHAMPESFAPTYTVKSITDLRIS